MEYKRFGQQIVVRLDRGEEILEQLAVVAEKEKIQLASISALGATDDFTLGVFNVAEKKYYKNHFTFPAEITALVGSLSTMDGKCYAHLHLTAADATGKAYGGHLNEARISATCEMIITLIDGHVGRSFSQEIGIPLFDFCK